MVWVILWSKYSCTKLMEEQSPKNSQSYSSFSSIGLDNRVVSCHVNFGLRSSKKSKIDPIKSIGFQQVYTNSDLLIYWVPNLIKANEVISLSFLPKKQEEPNREKSKHYYQNFSYEAYSGRNVKTQQRYIYFACWY